MVLICIQSASKTAAKSPTKRESVMKISRKPSFLPCITMEFAVCTGPNAEQFCILEGEVDNKLVLRQPIKNMQCLPCETSDDTFILFDWLNMDASHYTVPNLVVGVAFYHICCAVVSPYLNSAQSLSH